MHRKGIAALFDTGAPDVGLFNDYFAQVPKGDFYIARVVPVQLFGGRQGFSLCLGHGYRSLVELDTCSMV